MQLTLKKYVLSLKHTFSISRESHDFQDTLIVSLSLDGKTGYGETTSNPYYGITMESLTSEIEAIRKKIEDFEFRKVESGQAAASGGKAIPDSNASSSNNPPEVFHAFLNTQKLSNFARCALDLAAHDLYGKLLGQPLYKIWDTSLVAYPTTNYTIGIASVEKMIAKMQEVPWPIYKIKLGTENDVAIVRELRKHTDAVFRIDANCAWSAEETIENAPALRELGIEFLEQPLKADDLQGMKQVAEHCVLPVIADESCIVESDVDQCVGLFDGINIKLTKCGGLTPALRMLKRARELGLKTMVGCMTESTVGISAIAQLLPQLDYVDMDGPLLLKEDIADGVQILPGGKLVFPELGGSGIRLR